jgi:hypothetical protein
MVLLPPYVILPTSRTCNSAARIAAKHSTAIGSRHQYLFLMQHADQSHSTDRRLIHTHSKCCVDPMNVSKARSGRMSAPGQMICGTSHYKCAEHTYASRCTQQCSLYASSQHVLSRDARQIRLRWLRYTRRRAS